MRDGNFRGSRCTEGRSMGEGVNVLHSVEAAPFSSPLFMLLLLLLWRVLEMFELHRRLRSRNDLHHLPRDQLRGRAMPRQEEEEAALPLLTELLFRGVARTC